MKILKEHSLIKTQKAKDRISTCMIDAKLLDKAEKELEERQDEFEEAERIIKELTGLELFPHHDNGLLVFWWANSTGQVSDTYENREDAVRALLNDKIEWC